ncbi:MAG: 30S ribosomal protein S6 [Thermoanaerobacteraceae bacterium]|uniref:Small ribosomal subunit protein bS6 n=1 Tax=Desulfofundulus thermobenzoicus TaxID=29376 RepID=A0A6N7IU23_9FIRM|nr:30S ribosomal protein S6 [Desulfofundulus thermobenzoicus]MBE3587872.1 30S ribosomal protein S6 [Thermoanaerobacteraceae bacterium]MQL53635.1 30S ribosomal protein S6 [Desulfofundulus thermobenzoicus]HHW43179.1 30S ribosomal protein S6 [Desulfotomaculum sp.]
MRSYELLFIVRPDMEDEKIAEAIEKFKTLITTHGGQVTRAEKWGKRRLAYEIARVREGVYIIFQFNAPPAVAQEVDRVLKITDYVLRHIIVHQAAERPAAS